MKAFDQVIPFNIPPLTGSEATYLIEVIKNQKFSGDGPFTKRCSALLEKKLSAKKIMLTTSCTDALEMTAILLDLKPGDEVIVPSFTFVSTANAFALRGAQIVFVDINPRTMNVDPELVEASITEKTKAIVLVHYAGVSCDMDGFLRIREKYKIPIIEDAAQSLMSTYKENFLGTIGDLGCFSFHETKNYSCGEGGALVINNPQYIERAEIIREKGTNRTKFFKGLTDKYTWVDIGSSFLMSDLSAAFLLSQIEKAEHILEQRLIIWNRYNEAFQTLSKNGLVQLPYIPMGVTHNAHMFYLVLRSEQERDKFIEQMKARNVSVVFHYIPLHSSPAGKIFSRFHGEDLYTSNISQRLIRLPMYLALTKREQDYVIKSVHNFFEILQGVS